MIGLLADKITEYFFTKNIIAHEDKSIYKYGAEITLSSLSGLVLILIIGVITRSVYDSIIFLICFATIRIFSGGYHADTYLKCSINIMMIYLIIISIKKIIPAEIYVYLGVLMIITSFIIMLILSPVENKNKPLSSCEKIKYRKNSIVVFVLWALAGSILLILNIKISMTIFLTVFVIAILMLIEKNKR